MKIRPARPANVLVTALIQETFDNPADYYTRIAEYHLRSRNFDRALDAYEQALRYDPDNRVIQSQITQLTGED